MSQFLVVFFMLYCACFVFFFFLFYLQNHCLTVFPAAVTVVQTVQKPHALTEEVFCTFQSKNAGLDFHFTHDKKYKKIKTNKTLDQKGTGPFFSWYLSCFISQWKGFKLAGSGVPGSWPVDGSFSHVSLKSNTTASHKEKRSGHPNFITPWDKCRTKYLNINCVVLHRQCIAARKCTDLHIIETKQQLSNAWHNRGEPAL